MERLARFSSANAALVTRLPVTWQPHELSAGTHLQFPIFGAIFDAAAVGQWAGGVDPRHNPNYCCFSNRHGWVRVAGRKGLQW